MAIPLIDELAQETRRLAVAGSALAKDDYRVRKLIPGLEKLGEKAPVFKKVAETAERAISAEDKGRSILELATLLNAIQYTQGSIGCEGELAEIPSGVTEWRPTDASYRALSGVVEALTQTGSGRLGIIEDALDRGVFGDARLMRPAIDALGDGYSEIVNLIETRVLPEFGSAALPLLLDGFDPKGLKINARKLGAICRIDPELGRQISREALEGGLKDIRLAAIEGLRGSVEDAELIMSFTKDRSKDVKRAAVRALAGIKTKAVLDFIKGLLKGKLAGDAAYVAAASGDAELMDSVIAKAREALHAAVSSKGAESEALETIAALLPGLERQLAHPEAKKLLLEFFDMRIALGELNFPISILLYRLGDAKIDKQLVAEADAKGGHFFAAGFGAACRSLSPKAMLKRFGRLLGKHDELEQWLNLWRCHVPILEQGYVEFPATELDPGWVDAAIRAKKTWLVVRLAREGQKQAIKFLLSRDANRNYYNEREVLAAILRVDPKRGADTVLKQLLELQKGGNHAWYWRYALGVIHHMPASVLPKLEAFGAQLKPDYREHFDDALAEYRMNHAR